MPYTRLAVTDDADSTMISPIRQSSPTVATINQNTAGAWGRATRRTRFVERDLVGVARVFFRAVVAFRAVGFFFAVAGVTRTVGLRVGWRVGCERGVVARARGFVEEPRVM